MNVPPKPLNRADEGDFLPQSSTCEGIWNGYLQACVLRGLEPIGGTMYVRLARLVMVASSVFAFTFWEQLVLNLVGPVVTIILGTAIVGFAVSLVARRAQERREDHELRARLCREATEASTALYLATQHYWRAQQDNLEPDHLKAFRADLDKEYLESRRAGTALEHLLGLYFRRTEPKQRMHQVMDLLTVRYFQLVTPNGASEGLRKINAGDKHSGLSWQDLGDPRKVLTAYQQALKELIAAVANGDLAKRR